MSRRFRPPRPELLLACAAFSPLAIAHAAATSGWLHPLSGLDHLLAMIAVGAWSAQIGGRAIWTVPAAFLSSMVVGAVLGMQLVDLPWVEVGVASSVVVLGLAIGMAQRMPWPLAAAGVGLFGLLHGYAHGYEMPVIEDKLAFSCGFLATTAALHLVGAVGGFWILRAPKGPPRLQASGWAAAVCGLWLVTQAVGYRTG